MLSTSPELSPNTSLRILVVGANGATGRIVTSELAARGHTVTAFVRRPDAMGDSLPKNVRVAVGDVMQKADVDRVMPGHDAVVVALGIRENALKVRLFGSAATAMNVRSRGTQHVADAMRRHGVQRLVVQTTYGVSETHEKLSWIWKLIFRLILQPQIADSERQEHVVHDSGLDWVLVRPVGLNDTPTPGPVLVSSDGETRSMSVSRLAVADVLVDATQRQAYVHQRLAVSA